MWQETVRLIRLFHYVGDLVAILAAFLLALLVRNFLVAPERAHFSLMSQLLLLGLVLPTYLFTLQYVGMYPLSALRNRVEEGWLILKACLWASILLIAFIFLLRVELVSRLVIGLTGIFSFMLVLIGRFLLRLAARRGHYLAYPARYVVIVGSGARARSLYQALQETARASVFCLIDDLRLIDAGTPLDEVRSLVERHVVDEVIIGVEPAELPLMQDLMLYCQQIGISTSICANPFPQIGGRIKLDEVVGTPLLTFYDNRQSRVQLLSKRVFDIAAALALLAVFAPVILSIALLTQLLLKGPIFFKQVRVGLHGRRFVLYKFRTMVVGAEKLKEELLHLNEMDGPVFKIRSDPRMTPLGRFLRRTSLDELPQLFNVLKGDMSMVGPRPPLPDEVEKYDDWQRRRLSVKPGLTCVWQVSGRNEIDFETWVNLDLQYIDNWSWKLDAMILLRTIPALFRGI